MILLSEPSSLRTKSRKTRGGRSIFDISLEVKIDSRPILENFVQASGLVGQRVAIQYGFDSVFDVYNEYG